MLDSWPDFFKLCLCFPGQSLKGGEALRGKFYRRMISVERNLFEGGGEDVHNALRDFCTHPGSSTQIANSKLMKNHFFRIPGHALQVAVVALLGTLAAGNASGADTNFFTANLWPPTNSMHVSTQSWVACYANGILISNLAQRLFTKSFPPHRQVRRKPQILVRRWSSRFRRTAVPFGCRPS